MSRWPQSWQSAPIAQLPYSAPGPPSSHAPSDEKLQSSRQRYDVNEVVTLVVVSPLWCSSERNASSSCIETLSEYTLSYERSVAYSEKREAGIRPIGRVAHM